MNQIFEPVDLRQNDPDKLEENINKYITRIRENRYKIGPKEAIHLRKSSEWFIHHYDGVIDEDTKDSYRKGSANILTELDGTNAIRLLQCMRMEISSLTSEPEYKENSGDFSHE